MRELVLKGVQCSWERVGSQRLVQDLSLGWVGGGGGGGSGDTLHVLSHTHFLKIHYIVMHLYESLYTSLISVWSLHAFIFVLLVELNFS